MSRDLKVFSVGMFFGALLVAIELLILFSVPAATFPPPSGTATEGAMLVGSPWCPPPRGCLGLDEWKVLASDKRLRDALAVAYQYNPDWRGLAQQSAKRRVQFKVATLKGQGGEYDPSSRTIVIDPGTLSYSVPFVAAALAHEVYHSALPRPVLRGDNCVSEEEAAAAWQAATFSLIPYHIENELQYLLIPWRADTLREYLLSHPSYRKSCFGPLIDLLPGASERTH